MLYHITLYHISQTPVRNPAGSDTMRGSREIARMPDGNGSVPDSWPDCSRPDCSRPDQTRRDETRPDQTRPERTRWKLFPLMASLGLEHSLGKVRGCLTAESNKCTLCNNTYVLLCPRLLRPYPWSADWGYDCGCASVTVCVWGRLTAEDAWRLPALLSQASVSWGCLTAAGSRSNCYIFLQQLV